VFARFVRLDWQGKAGISVNFFHGLLVIAILKPGAASHSRETYFKLGK
jgi:hypothetical protein